MLPIYAPTEAPLTDLNIPFDGTCLTIGTLNLLPTSRGSVTIASTDPSADPLIDPKYYATEADRIVLRHGMRLAMRAIETSEGQSFIEHEVVPQGYRGLTSKSSDEEIEERVKRSAATWFHFAGSAAMGKVVDCDLRVYGVQGLRICDASVLPCPIGAHYKVVTYALAEQGAEIITASWAGN
jgi:choline dehydrogenase-like flavoprotein